MIIREFSHLTGPPVESLEIELPLVVNVTGGTATLDAGDGEGDYRLVFERTIAPSALTLRRNTQIRHVDTGAEIPKIEIDRDGIEGHEAPDDIGSVLSFLTEKPFTVSVKLNEDSELVCETAEEEDLLTSLGIREVWRPLSGTVTMRTFHEPITTQLVEALLPKHVGLQLYADSVRHGSQVARYRDLWRVLESAFAMKGDDLIAALAAYEPAIQIGFTKDELEELHIDRGRASHAESRAGIDELRRVRKRTAERVGRLNTLVERVLMTKKQWGSRSAAVEELAKLRGYVGRYVPDDHDDP